MKIRFLDLGFLDPIFTFFFLDFEFRQNQKNTSFLNTSTSRLKVIFGSYISSQFNF